MDTLANQGEGAAVRAGQFWEIDGGLLEVTSVNTAGIQGRRWSRLSKSQKVGSEVSISLGERDKGGAS